MLKTFIFIVGLFIVQTQVFAQNQIGKLSVKVSENWKISKSDANLLQIDYQKASTRIQIHFLSNKNSDEASKYMVEMFKSQNVDPVKFQKAVQSKVKFSKTEAVKFTWADEMFMDSQNKTFVTNYQLLLLEYKEEKYYILSTDYFIKEDQTAHDKEINDLLNLMTLK